MDVTTRGCRSTHSASAVVVECTVHETCSGSDRRGIEWSADGHLLTPSPTTFAGEWQVCAIGVWGTSDVGERREDSRVGGMSAQEDRSGAREEDVVEAEVPDRGEGHAEGGKGAHRADETSGEDIVPVVVAVDRHGSGNKNCTEDGSEEEEHLPVGRVVSAHDLELRVEVEREEQETSEGGG